MAEKLTIQHFKSWWWIYFLCLVFIGKFIDWWGTLDFSYGSSDCTIPILGSWIIVIALGILMIIHIQEGGE